MLLLDIFSVVAEIIKQYGVSGVIGLISVIVVYGLFTRNNEKLKQDYLRQIKESNIENAKAVEGVVTRLSEFVLNNNSQVIKLLESSIDNKTENKANEHNGLLEERMNISNEINNIIEDVRLEVNANRTMVIELHNSNMNINGDPFAKFSVNFESIDRGLTPLSIKYKSLPYSNIALLCKELTTRQLIRVDNIDNIDKKYIILQAYLLTENIHSAIVTGIFNSVNKLTGIFIVGFNDKITDHCQDSTIINATTKLCALLNMK